MTHSPNRRLLLLAMASLPFSGVCADVIVNDGDSPSPERRLERLEGEFDGRDGRLGVFALNTANGAQLAYRANERFALCSTFKVLAVAAVLARSARQPDLLQQQIKYEPSELVDYSPVTEKHVGAGMTVAALCAAAIQYSDNTAGNLLMKMVGGPDGVTAYARSIGDHVFRLDRWETDLNSAIPDDRRDTSTPAAMGHSLRRLVLGDALAPPERELLQTLLHGNTTGAARISAGIPAGWTIGDKTGGGRYGTANDIAVLWPPQAEPVVVAIYTTQHQEASRARNDIIASAAKIVVDWVRDPAPHLRSRR